MATLSSLLHLGASGFRASQQGVRAASDNIANVDTPEFRRRQSVRSARATNTVGAGHALGGGVQVDGIKRVVDNVLERQLQGAKAHAGFSSARSDALSRAEVLFGDLEGVGATSSLDALFGSFDQLAAEPQDTGARLRVLSAAAEFATSFNTLAVGLQDQQRELDRQIADQVDQINTLSDRIAGLNQQIGATEHPSEALLDERDAAVHELSTLVGVNVIESNSMISVSLRGSGFGLVTEGVSRPLSSTTASGAAVISGQRGESAMALTDSLALGTLSGTVEARNHDLQTLTDSIDRFVFAFTAEVNRVHAAGVGADGQGGRNLFVTSPSEGGAALALQLDPALIDNPERVAASQDARLVPGDNRNAVELSMLRQAVLTTDETAEASLQTVITDFADVVASVSGRVQVQTAIQDNFEQMQAGLSGVNIDEEMTLLLQYRQSYSAAAQVVRTADELMREVVALKR